MDENSYQQRRRRLMEQVSKGAVVLLPSAKEVIRNGDAHYPFRQNSDFFYLSGFSEPESVIVLTNHPCNEFIMFNRPNDPRMETWTGKRAGQQGARFLFGADRAYPIDELRVQLPTLLENCHTLYYPFGHDVAFDQLIIETINHLRTQHRSGINAPEQIVNLDPLLHEMRLFKDAEEIALMQASADISAKAHIKAMRRCRPGMKEYELEAILLETFVSNGSRAPAYSCIVAGGENACTLHYIENDADLKAGDLVLIDAGAEVGGYAADITRTFPVSGKFSASQHLLYELVLKAQLEIINMIKPGVYWHTLQETAVRVLTEGLVQLGLLSGKIEELIATQAYQAFYMHGAGHWLGLDVHDVGLYKQNQHWRQLEPGMVLTVEPGLYVKSDNPLIDSRWWGIGIRIEDDVLVTQKGSLVLSHKVPKTIEEIEALMSASCTL